MLRLGVNIDHVATLRQARGTAYPNVVEAAKIAEAAGANSITIHLREDRRHIQDADVYALRMALCKPMNLEMAIHSDIIDIACDVKPEEICLVPERREERTTEGGLDCVANFSALDEAISRLRKSFVFKLSLFIAPDIEQIKAAEQLGASCIELHTGTFCERYEHDPRTAREELERLAEAAEQAHRLRLQVNAGHGLNLSNVAAMRRIPHLDTLNIGHSIIARAVFVGLEQAVREMLEKMSESSSKVLKCESSKVTECESSKVTEFLHTQQ